MMDDRTAGIITSMGGNPYPRNNDGSVSVPFTTDPTSADKVATSLWSMAEYAYDDDEDDGGVSEYVRTLADMVRNMRPMSTDEREAVLFHLLNREEFD